MLLHTILVGLRKVMKIFSSEALLLNSFGVKAIKPKLKKQTTIDNFSMNNSINNNNNNLLYIFIYFF